MSSENTRERLVTFLLPKRFIKRLSRYLGRKENTERDRCNINLDAFEFSVWGNRNVLVGALKDATQLDICLQNRFYHIPKVLLDCTVPVRYVALYQSKRLFGENACVQYYGEVSGCQILKRNEIKEISSDRQDLYYRFEIKEWKKLKEPIRIKETGCAAILTNYFLLKNSREVPQLSLKNLDDFELYCFLMAGEFESHFSYHHAEIICEKEFYRIIPMDRNGFRIEKSDFLVRPSFTLYNIKNRLLNNQ